MIRGTCGACSTPWKVPIGIAGKTAQCSSCGHVFGVPTFVPGPTPPPAVAVDPMAFLDDDDAKPDRRTALRGRSSGVEMIVAASVGLGMLALLLFVWINRQAEQPGGGREGSPLAQVAAGGGMVAVVVASVVVGVLLYVVPSIIAHRRGHPNFPSILCLNLLLGWAFVGWVGALVWVLTEVRSRDHHHDHYR